MLQHDRGSQAAGLERSALDASVSCSFSYFFSYSFSYSVSYSVSRSQAAEPAKAAANHTQACRLKLITPPTKLLMLQP